MSRRKPKYGDVLIWREGDPSEVRVMYVAPVEPSHFQAMIVDRKSDLTLIGSTYTYANGLIYPSGFRYDDELR